MAAPSAPRRTPAARLREAGDPSRGASTIGIVLGVLAVVVVVIVLLIVLQADSVSVS